MAGPRVALVTAAAARALDDDLLPLAAALREAGVQAVAENWDDAHVDWSRYALALLRSPWDYVQRFAEFRAWLDRAGGLTRLLNPPEVVRWNIDKHYLADLAEAGVAVVPSRFCEPGEDAAEALAAFLERHEGVAELVVKPAVGAGSRDAQRHDRDAREAARAHMQRLLDAGRSVLLQPYLERVDAHGETALIYFEGEFSHAIRKGALLRRGEGPTDGLFAVEAITPRTPTAEERALADAALAALPFSAPLLYARVDLIHDGQAQPRLLELELAEPSLFFAHAPGSAERFARAVKRRLDAG
jgi:O-ureido-D-serine cyclo-ligase